VEAAAALRRFAENCLPTCFFRPPFPPGILSAGGPDERRDSRPLAREFEKSRDAGKHVLVRGHLSYM
jgi:hypothetical protein